MSGIRPGKVMMQRGHEAKRACKPRAKAKSKATSPEMVVREADSDNPSE